MVAFAPGPRFLTTVPVTVSTTPIVAPDCGFAARCRPNPVAVRETTQNTVIVPAGGDAQKVATSRSSRGRLDLAVSWDLLISTAGGVSATVVGVVAGGFVGRRSQNRQWLQGTQTAAYERFLQAFGAVESELREAFLDERRPAVDWGPFVAATHSVSLVADQETSTAAEQLCEIMEDFTILFHGRQPTDLEELRPIHTALGAAHLAFVNAARRSLDPSQVRLDRSLGGPSPWRGVESFHARADKSLD